MSAGRTVRRAVIASALIVAGGFAAMHLDVVETFYRDIYPSDSAKRQALELCFLQDHKFNRLDPDERETCYRHLLYAAGETAMPARPDANPVDLQRAAGRGILPRTDIRRPERPEDADRPPR
jgi:hypothetical protein